MQNLNASLVQPNPNLPAYNHCNKVNTHLNAWNNVIMQMWCNAWTFRIIYTKPIPKISQKLQKISKTQNLDLNAWNAWRMRDKEIIPSYLRQGKAKNHMGWRFWERIECLRGEKIENNWERSRRNEEKIMQILYIEKS